MALHSCCGRIDQRGWQLLLSQALREIVQILRDDVVAGQLLSLICVQDWRDTDELLGPALVFRHGLNESCDMLLEVVHVGYELVR